ncbi:unnamed protein product, partial [Darwinula stevensoni]
ERIEFDIGELCESVWNPAPLISLLDKSSQGDPKDSTDSKGILWLLDDQAIYPGASEDSFLRKVASGFSSRDWKPLVQARIEGESKELTLNHLQGTSPIRYDVHGWLKAVRDNPTSRVAPTLLLESSKEEMREVFTACSRSAVPSTISGSIVGVDGGLHVRRASSIRRGFASTSSSSLRRKS